MGPERVMVYGLWCERPVGSPEAQNMVNRLQEQVNRLRDTVYRLPEQVNRPPDDSILSALFSRDEMFGGEAGGGRQDGATLK